MSDDATRPDAVLLPHGHFSQASKLARRDAMRAEFGPVLGHPEPHAFAVFATPEAILVAPTAATSFNFPSNHPRAGESRYEWADAPGKPGVRYGTLKPEAREITGDDRDR